MKYTLYQIQLETRKNIYSFEVGTNEFDAREWAEAYLANEEDFGPFHIGGHCRIGESDIEGVVEFRKT